MKIHALTCFFIQKNIKQLVHHVAIYNNILFSFCTHLACFFRALLTLAFNKLLVYSR